MDLLCVATTILRPCPNEIPCPGSDSPVINWSSEQPDPPDFIGIGFFGDSTTPPIGSTWTATACGKTFTSTISQADADLQALIASYQCLKHDWEPPGTVDCCNDEQCCTIPGPDGDTVFCIPAGSFCALTCAEANEQAKAVACYLAKRHLMRLSALPTKLCAGVDLSTTIHATNAFGVTSVLLWTVVSGALPPGISIGTGFDGATIPVTGNPTTGGSYTFTVRATNDTGNYVQRVYTMCVIDVVPTPGGSGPNQLPDANIGQSYTNTLAIPACATGATFSIISGALPVGLSLNPTTGVISGTPTAHTPLGYIFTVRVAGTGFQCDNTFTMVTVNPVTLTVDAYWTLNEAVAGPRIDSVSALPLADNSFSTPGVPALFSDGIPMIWNLYNGDFATANTPDLSFVVTTGFSVFGWFKINTECNDGSFGPRMFLTLDGDILEIEFGNTFGGQKNVFLTWFSDTDNGTINTAGVTVGAWHFFHAFYDATLQKVGISLDNGANTYDGTAVIYSNSINGLFQIFGSTGTNLNMIFDEIGIKTGGLLTPAQVAYLYNGGAGRTWPL